MSLKDLNDDEILEHLKNNTILRNQQLRVLVKLLNSFKDNTTIAIDGAWGSGKTVFVKQLCMLADKAVEDYGRNTLDDAAIATFRESQKLFYFNAWESDYLGDALSAILLKLIAADDEGFNEANIKRAFSMLDPAAMVKTVTADLVNLEGKRKKEKLVESVKMLVDRHDAVNEFIDTVKGDSQRVVFIIDELDRCKPSFAVDVLETVKHYFTRNDITFILTTNVKELSHTVKKYYGYEFDSYLYLTKFFDFIFGLQQTDIESYTRAVLSWETSGMVVDEVAHDAIRHFGFEMREINSYYSALRLIDNFLRRERNWEQDQWSIQLIFVPLALALKVKNDARFSNFISGKDADILRGFMPSSSSAMRFANRLVEDRTNKSDSQIQQEGIGMLVGHYQKMFTPEGRWRRSENHQSFHEAVSLISDYTTIVETKEEK